MKLGVGVDEAYGLSVGRATLVELELEQVVELKLFAVSGASMGDMGRNDDEANIAVPNPDNDEAW